MRDITWTNCFKRTNQVDHRTTNSLRWQTDHVLLDTTVDDAYDCCVAAVTLADTSVWAFEPNPFSGEGGNCFIGQTGDTCPSPATNPSTAESGFGDLVIGNSYCGEINADVPIAVSKRAEPTAR